MKKAWIITLAAALLLISISGTSIAANSTEIRGPVVDDSSSMYTWTAKDFGGFYYDVDKNITTEEITSVNCCRSKRTKNQRGKSRESCNFQ